MDTKDLVERHVQNLQAFEAASSQFTPETVPEEAASESSASTVHDDEKQKPTPFSSTDQSDRPTYVRRTTTGKSHASSIPAAQDVDAIVRMLSRRTTAGASDNGDENQHDLESIMGGIFGRSEDDISKRKNVGVIWKDLTVKGVGVGVTMNETFGGIFLKPFKKLPLLFSHRKPAENTQRTILHNFTGSVKDGEMLLVLGRPGSGCSTFLKTLASQTESYDSVNGDITYGGLSAKEVKEKYRGEVVYNAEDDVHYATLTVKQTLAFALKTRTPRERPDGMSRSQYRKTFLDILGRIFGIEHTFDTRVGNEFIRGVSGGEKKRVSIAETMVTRGAVGCWDNSTRGLDASTALEYCRSLRVLTNLAKVSTIVTIYQAGEGLYELFDKVLVIDQGRCVFFGPTDIAKEYFENLGFKCPSRQTTADFLTSVTDPNARVMDEGRDPKSIPRTAADLEKCYRDSPAFKANVDSIRQFEQEIKETQPADSFRDAVEQGKAKRASNRSVYTISFFDQVKACTIRQYQVVWGDKTTFIGKNFLTIFQALIIGSLFYNMPATSAGVFTRGGVMFFSLLFNALVALSELTDAFASRPILLKHKSFTFYRPAAYALAQLAADVPVVFIQVACFDLVTYFLTNLARTPGQFFINFFVLYIITMTMYAFFRMLGALCSSLDVATRISGISIQALVVYAGYIIPRPSMHPWLYWLYYINPVAYGFEALMANEFHNLQLTCVAPQLVPAYGSPENQGCTLAGSTPGTNIVSGDAYLEAQLTYSYSHLWRNVGIIFAFWGFFVAVTLWGMEMILTPHKGGGDVNVYKKGAAPESVQKALEDNAPVLTDEEAQRENGAEAEIGRQKSEAQDRELQSIAKSETIFTWNKIRYVIPVKGGKKVLLDDVQGYVKPGRLTALMGESGAGKTTLLNCLAQRVSTGVITGEMLIDGRPLPKSFQRSTGYVEQLDVHEHTSTVREALRFSALLRQPKEVPREEKYEYVEKIIKLLEMEEIAEAIIGTGGAGLSVEQRKRVTIGVELASKPQLLLFLDEPTSGLDAQSAFNIVRFLRKLCDAGQAILCTIHQPSAILFEHFDDLLLLQAGGKTVYFGELGSDSQTLIKYLEKNGAPKCKKNANPAEYMLDAIGAGATAKTKQDWSQVWTKSDECKRVTEEVQKICKERKSGETSKFMKDQREYAMPLTTQILAVTKRSFTSYWRDPDYLLGKFFLHVVTGLFNTFTFWMLSDSQVDMQNRLFSIFITLTISPPLIQQLQPRYLDFRNIFSARENASKIYNWVAFVFAALIVEIPWSLLFGTIYYFCWYWGVGFPRGSPAAGYIWLMLMAFEVYYVTFGQAMAAVSPNAMFASLLVPTLFSFVIAFCGVLSPPQAMPHFWSSWMYWLTPFHYLLEGMMSVVVHDQPVVCTENEFARFIPPQGQTCQQWAGPYIQQIGGYLSDPGNTTLCQYCQYANGDEYAAGVNVYYEHHWRDYGIFIGYIFFNIIMIFFITWLFFGGYKRFIPTKAVENVRQHGKSNDDEEKQEGTDTMSGPDYIARSDDRTENQYIQEGQARG